MGLLAQDLAAVAHGPLIALLAQTLCVNTEECPLQLSISYRHLLSQGVKTPPPHSSILQPPFSEGATFWLVLKTIGVPGMLQFLWQLVKNLSFLFLVFL